MTMNLEERGAERPGEARGRGAASRRAGVAVAVLLAAMAGVAPLVYRAFFGKSMARPVSAAPLVTPGADFYAVEQFGEQIGFASTTLDTTDTGVQSSDYFLADLQTEGKIYRAWARLASRFTRALHLTDFVLTLSPEIGPLRATGMVSGDSLLTLVVAVGSEKPDTQRIRLPGATLLPNMVPLAVALEGRPRVGRTHVYSVFDPMGLRPIRDTVRVVAESVFVLTDSARPSRTSGHWVGTHRDTVRAWRIGGSVVQGWVDARGRLVEGTLLGLVPLRRTAYELAYTNWLDDTRRGGARVSDERDIQENTAIAASAPIRNKRAIPRLRVVLKNADLAGYDLNGARQRLTSDTLEIRRETDSVLRAAYTLPASAAQFGATLAAEPLVQSDDSQIVALAHHIVGAERDPRRAAARITTWVHDSLEKKTSFSIPNALQVLRLREGDCNEHTQLFVALARAAGIPARSVAGLAYVGKKFYYHAWPEVYLGDWVAVDPTFGQFPADAAHLRFVIGGFKKQAELLRLIGALGIDVIGDR